MANQNSPSRGLNTESELDSVMSLAFRKQMLDVNDMLPAEIVSWDKDRNRAQVKINYLVTMTSGDVHQLEAPAEVPTFILGSGELVLVWPLKPGDLGWIKATDRDISLFLQHYDAQAGNTPRIHCFEDGLFIPDAMKDFVMADAEAACLQTSDGTTSVAVKAGSIKLTVGSTVLTITEAGIESNKTIKAPQFTNGPINLIGHIHTDSSGDTIGPARNP